MNFPRTTVRLGAKRVLVARPDPRHYGHLGLEVVMSLAHAREKGADVYFVRPSNPLGSGVFELESSQVRVLRPPRVFRELFRTCISWRNLRERVDGWREDLREEFERELLLEASRYVDDTAIPDEVRSRVRETRRRLRVAVEHVAEEKRQPPPYYERRLLRTPVPVQLHAMARQRADREAQAVGIAPDARLVCIHAREAGYKRGSEIHETKPLARRDDSTRNARIETYLDAVNALVQRGYTVVRLGDPTMTPLSHPGVVDLATSPRRSNLLEIYCLLRSDLLIGGESGLIGITCVTNTPFLLTNATEPISSYPIRAPGLILPKTVVDEQEGRRLSHLELLGFEYQSQLRDTRRYRYVDNTADQIRQATEEMLEWIGGRWTESPAQRAYHDAIVSAASELARRLYYIRKWGLHEGFLGDGRIARAALATQ
jgi:putative glycosyltransferase (TIGR04372 family)